MKDIITALSGLIALFVFVVCMWSGVDLFTTLWKTVLIFVATNLITFAAFGVTSVTISRQEIVTHDDNDDDLLHEMETSNSDTNSEAAVNA